MAFKQVYGDPFYIPCRVQWLHLAEPDNGSKYSRKDKYHLTALIPKTEEALMGQILGALAYVGGVANYQELAKHPFMDDTGGFRDGDLPHYGGKDPAKKGCYFFVTGAGRDFQPDTMTILSGDGVDPVACNPREIYAGCYCAILVTPAMYNNESHIGPETTLYLNAVIMIGHGERLASGRVDPVQAFRNWAQPSVANNAPAAQEVAQAQPVQQVAQSVAPAPAFGGQQIAPAAGEPQRRRRGRPAGTGTIAQGPAVGGAPMASAPAMTGAPAMASTAGPQFPSVAPAQGPATPNGRSNMSDLMNP